MLYNNEKPDEAKIVGNYKPEHLYTAHFKNGEGKFFNVVTEESGDTTIEYNQPIPTHNPPKKKKKKKKEGRRANKSATLFFFFFFFFFFILFYFFFCFFFFLEKCRQTFAG